MAITEIPLKALTDFSDLKPRVAKHLSKVYTTLAALCLASACGIYVDMTYRVGGLLTMLACLILAVCVAVPSLPKPTRLAAALAGSFCLGTLSGQLVEISAAEDVITAVVGAFLVFVCFSMAAITTQRRSFLFLGSLLSAALSAMVWLSFVNIFFRSPLLHLVYIYGGLLMFSAFILFDTQLIVERASAGHKDYIKDAYELFLDLFGVFIRLLIILNRNSKKRRQD